MTKQEVVEVKQQENKPRSYNTRPRLLARVLTSIVDIFLVFLLGFLLLQLELSTPISNKYHSLKSELIQMNDSAKLETNYGYKYYEDEEGYSKYIVNYTEYVETDTSSEKVGKKYVVLNHDNISNEVKTAFESAIKNNGVYQDKFITYRAIYFGLEMLAIGSVELVMFLVVPLFSRKRQTVGNYVALTCLISNKESEVKWWQVLIRFLFILLVETALPLFYLTEMGALLVVIVVNSVVMIVSRNSYRTLRDYVSLTKIIDKNTFKLIIEQ